MAGRFAGKYDVLDQEVKLGIQILSAVEVPTHRKVQIYCLPLSALQIELPCPPEFIERRFRSAVTLEGAVIEADVDPETENAYVVVAAPGSTPDAGFAAPTMEFNAWRASAAHQPLNEATSGAATMERPVWSADSPGKAALRARPTLEASAGPAVSFTNLFGEESAALAAGAAKAQAPLRATPLESVPQPKKQMESFTAFFKVGPSTPSPSHSPEVSSEAAAPFAQPVASFGEAAPPAPQPQGGGFTAFFSAGKSSQPSSEPQSFATPAPAPLPKLQPAAQSPSGGFTQLFGVAASPSNAGAAGSSFPEAQFATPPPMPAATPAPQFAAPAPKEPAAGSFTAMFSAPPSAAPATPSAEANFSSRFASSEPAAKAPGAFTELFRRMPDLQPSANPATAEPAMAPPPASAGRSDGFTGIFGTPGAAPPSAPAPFPTAAPASTPSPGASPDLAPRLDRPSTATQYGANAAGAGGAGSTTQQQTPGGNRAAGPSEYTKVRKAWSAAPPEPAMAAGQPAAGAAPQMAGGIPAPQWPSAPAVPTMPMAPQVAMTPPQMASAQPQVPGYPGFAPPAPPAWPPVAMPPQPAAAAAPGQAKSKPSYLPLIITLNALFVLAIIIVLVFVLTKH